MAIVVQVIKPTSYKLLPEGVFNHAIFYLFHFPVVEPPSLNFDSGHSLLLPPLDTVLTGAQHQQSQQKDGWSFLSRTRSRVFRKQYPELQQYRPETVPGTVRTQVQPQKRAISLPGYLTVREQLSLKQPESLHHASRVTGTVETFPRFVHLSVLWLVINTAVLVLCMWKNERQSGYQMLSFNAGCTHLLLLYFLCMHLPPPHPTAFLVCIMS